MPKAPTARDVAEAMWEEVQEDWLYQEHAVQWIEEDFGPEFVYENENGNPAISRAVLREFRKLSETEVVWERGERAWRRRRDSDHPGRQQD